MWRFNFYGTCSIITILTFCSTIVPIFVLFCFAVRTALVALIAFMPTNPDGALGSLDYTKEERHALAIKSREATPKFGTPERQKLMDEVCLIQLSFVLADY